MNTYSESFEKYNFPEIFAGVQNYTPRVSFQDDKPAASLAMACIDLTTLDGNDNRLVVENLCRKALAMQSSGLPAVAAVCVYPNFIGTARKILEGSGIKVACVAGGFPSGQGMIQAKVSEITLAREEGADEIDILFPRGYLFTEEYQALQDELLRMKEASKGCALKVILESGEMKNPEHIFKASVMSILAGADFLKTSTGKTSIGYTSEAFFIMLQVIHKTWNLTGIKIGIKASGGVAEQNTAFQCLDMVKTIAGNEWLNPGLFRIGASRLADNLKLKLE